MKSESGDVGRSWITWDVENDDQHAEEVLKGFWSHIVLLTEPRKLSWMEVSCVLGLKGLAPGKDLGTDRLVIQQGL